MRRPAALDVAGLDRSVEACTDFYQHVNRKGIEATPIPDDRTSWGTAAGSAQRKAMDYYRSGMDLAAIDRAGVKPLQQSGLGLPERDYYLKDDDRTKQQREAYLKHVARMLELYGEPVAGARKHAHTIFAFESQLAKASRTRVELRDGEKNYNKRTVKALAAEAPEFAWAEHLRAPTALT